MILTRKNLIYFGFALLVGVIFAFGISSLTYQPVPLQVTENPYNPITPPSPAITILPPQYIQGSYADANNDTSGDPYAPAKAPVVVTTAPLPTITPIPTPLPDGVKRCENRLSPQWNSTLTNINQTVSVGFAWASVLPIVIIFVGIVMLIVGAFGHADSYTIPIPLNTQLNTSQSQNCSGFGSGVIGIIIAVGGVLVSLYIIGSLTSALSCVP